MSMLGKIQVDKRIRFKILTLKLFGISPNEERKTSAVNGLIFT
jgi:hypothetical protein